MSANPPQRVLTLADIRRWLLPDAVERLETASRVSVYRTASVSPVDLRAVLAALKDAITPADAELLLRTRPTEAWLNSEGLSEPYALVVDKLRRIAGAALSGEQSE